MHLLKQTLCIINDSYNAQTKAQRADKTEILTRINEWNNKLAKARELLLSGDIDGGDYIR